MLFDRFSFRERQSSMSEEESVVADLTPEGRTYSFTLATRQMVFLIAGYGFLCVLVFALGVIVGRATTPSETVAETDSSAPTLARQQPMPERSDFPPSGRIPLLPGAGSKPQTVKEPEFTFSPTLPESTTINQGDKLVAETSAGLKPTPTPEVLRSSEPPAVAPKADQPREQEPRRLAVMAENKPAESKPKTPTATRVSLSQAGGDYTIQVSSFQSMEQANDLKGRLSKKGYAAYVLSVNLSEKGTWHRVRVGNYRDKEGAERAANDLRSRESLPAAVMKR